MPEPAASPPGERAPGAAPPVIEGPAIAFEERLQAEGALPLKPNPMQPGTDPTQGLAERVAEVQEKLARVRQWLGQRQLDGVYLKQPQRFAWLTAGGSNCGLLSGDEGLAGVLVSPAKWYVIGPGDVLPRLLDEGLAGLGAIPKPYLWHRDLQGEGPNEAWYLERLVDQGRWITDLASPAVPSVAPIEELDTLRVPLTAWEIERYRWLGARAAHIVERVCSRLRPAVAEEEVAARLAEELYQAGIQPRSLLVAADERAENYPQAPPHRRPVRRHARIQLVASRGGVTVHLARSFWFDSPDQEWLQRYRTALLVSAALLARSRAGVPLSQLAQVTHAPDRGGVPVNRGGPLIHPDQPTPPLPGSSRALLPGTALVWGADLQSAALQDTFLLWPDRLEQLTFSAQWPTVEVPVGEQTYALPGVAVLPD